MFSSYLDYKRALWPSKSNLLPLGKECKEFDTYHSAQVYYYQYPYKIKIAPFTDHCEKIYEIKREVTLRRLQYEDFAEQFFVDKIRFKMGLYSDAYIYIKNHKDLVTFLNWFEQDVHSVYGPLSSEVAEYMADMDHRVTLRKPYYNKFDCKVYLISSKFNLNLRLFGKNVEHYAELQDIVNFIKSNTTEQDVKWIRPHNSRAVTREFYMDYEKLCTLIPFIKLQNPDIRLVITRCINK